jgi:hypothetical protein
MDYRWLTTEAAAKWLDLAAASDEPTLKLAARLRKDLTAEQVHLVLEQVDLRRRAEVFRSRTDFITAKALEQATDEWVAAYRPAFAAGAARRSRSLLQSR